MRSERLLGAIGGLIYNRKLRSHQFADPARKSEFAMRYRF
jgi:hypothetical protein